MSLYEKLLLSILILTLCYSASSQQTESKQQLTKQEYLQKSKSEKETGSVLLGIGTGMAAIEAIVFANEGIFSSSGESAIVVIGIGVIIDLISIPVFISSSKNARKAAAISFNNQ